MIAYTKRLLFIIQILVVFSFISCNKEFKADNFTAYFGGEIINPKNNFILFMKDDVVIDTIYLNAKNQFLKKFDSLTPGMYTFKHKPEYQYVYFEKNDSLMVRLNSDDFDESVVFCGRGDQKNNFLMEMYLKNEDDRNKMFDLFDYPISDFTANIDSSYKSKSKFYQSKKESINWSEDFDAYAKSSLEFQHYTKKEIYPIAHKMRTGESVKDKLPANYYSHRKKIDFNNTLLTNYSPFVRYLTHMLANVSYSRVNTVNNKDEALDVSIHKLNITDTLFKNKAIRNRILNNIAFSYLLEDQTVINNKKFLERYNQLSTDNSKHNEINKIGLSVQELKKGNDLKEIKLISAKGDTLSSLSLLNKKTVIFFWTENAESHLSSVHKKAIDFSKKHPGYQFIAINIDKDQTKWTNILNNYNFSPIKEYRAVDFEVLKSKWVITKLSRCILLDQNGKIDNGFVNMFAVTFGSNLK